MTDGEPIPIPFVPSEQTLTSVSSQMEQTIQWLSGILRNKGKWEALFKFDTFDTQSLIDGLNYFLSNPSFRMNAESWLLKHTVILLRKLCEVSALYPTCYVLENIQDISSKSGGGFCDIHQGRYDNQLLCLKVVRLYQDSNIRRLLKAHAREAILWSQLDHPNIVPFYGIFYLDRRERICLVSPWMENGDIVQYLERVPDAPRKLFVYDIANGLQYLHDRNIVHGDLKGRNVLIDDHQNACLADFGLSTVATDETIPFTRTASGVSGHTTRWASPELLEEDGGRTTCQSDLWAFGCVCYEVLTGLLPFKGCSEFQVISKLMRKELPADLDNTRLDPDDYFSWKLSELVKSCWSTEAMRRPACPAILQILQGVTVVQPSRGPSLESFTNRLLISQASVRTPGVLNQVEKANNLLEQIYSGTGNVQFSTHIDSQERLFVPPGVPHTPRPDFVVELPSIPRIPEPPSGPGTPETQFVGIFIEPPSIPGTPELNFVVDAPPNPVETPSSSVLPHQRKQVRFELPSPTASPPPRDSDTLYPLLSPHQQRQGFYPSDDSFFPELARLSASGSRPGAGNYIQDRKLKPIILPRETLPRFLSVAKLNTWLDRETCGLLLGEELMLREGSPPRGRHRSSNQSEYVVTTLLIPKQHGTSDMCVVDEEELVLSFTEERTLITLGWIHTHPSQSCFMSSVDLHTHSGCQKLLPESIAIVCAPNANPNSGIFRLTDPPGLPAILNCQEKDAFHPHPDLPIYTDADGYRGHVHMRDWPLEVVDLR